MQPQLSHQHCTADIRPAAVISAALQLLFVYKVGCLYLPILLLLQPLQLLLM
jgi:hypothetical protein